MRFIRSLLLLIYFVVFTVPYATACFIAFPFLLALLSSIGGILPDRVRRWTDVPFRFTVQPHGGGALRSGGAPPDHP